MLTNEEITSFATACLNNVSLYNNLKSLREWADDYQLARKSHNLNVMSRKFTHLMRHVLVPSAEGDQPQTIADIANRWKEKKGGQGPSNHWSYRDAESCAVNLGTGKRIDLSIVLALVYKLN